MRLLSTFFALIQSCFVFANTQNHAVEQVFSAIYNQHYKLADSLLQENKANMDTFYYSVLEIDLSYWQHVTGTKKPDYEAFEYTLKAYTSKSAETFNQKVIQLITLSYQLRYELKRFKILNAIATRKKTKNLFNELRKYQKQLPPEHQELFQLYSSLFQYFDNYLKPFFFSEKKSNCKNALSAMEQLVKSNKYLTKTLTNYFLGKTLLKYEKESQEAISHFQWLTTNYPNNKTFADLLQECKSQLN